MEFAVFENDKGVACIVIPCGGKTVEEVVAKAVPEGKAWTKITEADIPGSREFRDAWKPEGGKVKVHMPKAREIHMERIRAARDKELTRLDVEQLKGKDVSAEKQKLRDLPQVFDLSGAATPEELSLLWPEELVR